MLEDALDSLDYNNPGIAIPLTGDGAGYSQGAGFHGSRSRTEFNAMAQRDGGITARQLSVSV